MLKDVTQMEDEMNAAVLYGQEDVRIERMPVPQAEAGEIVVRVGAALTCGTDLKVYRRGYHAKMIVPPALFGHEFAGTVHELGEGVTNFPLGARVVALNSAPCGECFWCKRDQENLCEDLLFNNGAYAEYIRIPTRIVEKNTLIVPENLLLEHAALTEPLACVLKGLEDTRATEGDQVVVIGAGPIGLMFVHAASLAGMHVIAVVKRKEQIAAAKLFGARKVVQIGATADAVAAVRALTPEHRGADVAIEAVATPMTWQWAVDMVRRGGVVNFFGGCASGTKVELDTNRLHYNDITLRATFHHTPATCRKAFELLSSGRFDASHYITGHAPLVELNRVFNNLMERSSDIKTAIIP
jgi:L-iditol 2-dehydrogenase